ncbi:Ig-like domain-containing protein [Salegentibacter flavus]|uniref:Concanavalin A-like lectin/glucanases superfamily protein n=1 Tax=Salegentibacter flavus TaxID=287099 RepID=A0A1I4YTX0_9FLAO|nr:LamG-like jellyroll fold domain-containing protein [Salegentibacter flavus]SFN41475.1 Concanavalin A-like lectin/glucanases superfamily protein [Salegentibacter flavus]
MGKKLLSIFFILSLFLLNSLDGFGQCSDGPNPNTSASITLQGSSTICSDETISITSTINLDGAINQTYQWQEKIGSANWNDITGETGEDLLNYSPQNNSRFRLLILFCKGTTNEDSVASNISGTITVVEVTTATASISSNKTLVCPSESITFSASLTNQGSSPGYSWRVNGTELSSSENFSYNQFSDGDNVQLFMTSNKACATDGDDTDGDNAAESNIISISVKGAIPDQPGTISGPVNLCSNTAATYNITAVDRADSYQWILPTGWTGTSTSTNINITSGNVGNGQVIKVKAINECGESTESTLTVDVGPGIPSSPGTISAPSLICPGDSVTFSVTQDPNVNSYTWSLPLNWTIQGADDGASITAIAGGSNDDGNVQVFSTNDCESSSTSSLSINVNDPIPADPGPISGPTTVCPNTDVSYSISKINYADEYIWYLDNIELSGQNGTSININSGATGTKNLKVIAVNECVDPADYTSISGQTLQFTVDDGTPGETSITESEGSTNFCPGETGFIFSVTQDARIDNYSWTVPSGWTITAGAGTHEITVTSGQLGNDGNIEFTGTSNDCGSVTTTYPVNVKNPAPVINTQTISGDAKVCRDATGLTYTIPNIQYADNYVWTVPGNWSITSGQGTNSITVSAGSDDGNIAMYAENDCGETSILSLAVESVDAAPAQPGTISSIAEFEADPKICPPLNPLFLSVPYVSDEISYNWILPEGWEIIGDETSYEINVNVTAGGNYNDTETVQVTATNGCFTSAATTSFPMTISDYIITDLGDDQTVCSTTNQITIPGKIAFGNSKKFNPTYTAVNGNGTDVTGNLSGLPTSFNNYPNTFNITYNATEADKASGSVKVSVQVPPPATTGQDPDACGTGYAEMSIFFRPEPTASIAATEEICEGQTGEVIFTATPNTTITYNINSGSNQTIQIGETGESTITSEALSGDTTYSLTSIQYTDAPNCSTTISESADIIVNPSPRVEISYADHCSSETTPATVSYTNEIGAWETGIFSATGALGSEIQTDGTFIPANVTPGTYTVTYKIQGSGGCENVSVTTDVTIYEKVSITQEPLDQRTCESGNAEFRIDATGEGLSYQWYKDSASAGNEIPGATGNILSLTNVTASDAGDYVVVISGKDPCSPETSTIANLTVDQNINIDTQPAGLTVCEGEDTSLTFSASVGGVTLDNTFSYQWFKGNPGSGTEISGMNSATLPLNSVIPDDSGSYYVEITGPAEYECSKIVSEAAILDVRATPTVEISGDTSICSGGSTEIIFFGGIPGTIVTYRLNGDNNNQSTVTLDSNGEATLETGALQATNDTDTPFVYEIVSVNYTDSPSCTQNYTAALPSATVTVAANPDATISFTNDQIEFCTADNSEYTPLLTGPGEFSGGIWSANGININSSTGAFTPGAGTAGDYTITYTIPAYGGCAEETTTLDISIYEEVVITSQPTNLGICSTNDAEFFVGASGDGLTYQWYKNGNPVEGATAATLSLPVATSKDAGDYYAVVSGTNACTPDENSQVQSESVTLNVDEDIVIIEPADDVRVCDDTNASVEFKFVAHANGDPLIFEWIYADGSLVNPANQTNMQSSLIERDPTAEELANFPEIQGIQVYEGTLTISNITSADQASYAVRIDGSANNFNCPEAISNSFNLDVDPLPDAPTATSPIEYCLGETATELTVSGEAGATFTWYDSNNNELSEAPTPDTSTPGDITYYVTQKDTYCESPQTTVTVTIFDTPAAPVLTDEEKLITYCLGDTATPLSVDLNGAASANWYDSASSTTPLGEAPTPQTSAAGDINYWVSLVDNNGCESEKAMITVHTSKLPDIILPDDQEICEGDNFQVTASDNNEIIENTTTYYWNWDGNTGDPLTGAQQDLDPVETTTYTLTATNENGCTNTAQITIKVDLQPVAGALEGPESVCVTSPNGELNLTDYAGTIDRWEYRNASSTSWTAINEETPDADYQFSGLTEDTSYRVVVTNGVCSEVFSNEWNIIVDPEPVAGGLLFRGTDRVFMMCEFPTDDYLVPLQTSGNYVGEIVAWQYRRNSATAWATILENGEPFTGSTLSGQQVIAASNNESTIFRVEVQSGACSPNVLSETATLSIIPSDIAPNPVTASPGEICLGDIVTLNAGTGYGGNGVFEGGAFDNSSIANHGWRVKRFDSDTEYTFESAADNTRPDRWMRTNPHDFIMANPNGSGTTYQRFDSSSGDEGNKGFAIVSGNNPSTLETPVFNTYAMDNPTLTFDQAYNLTPGDTIKVQISLDGGNTYVDEPLFVVGGPAISGNYDRFGDEGLGVPNNMVIDLSAYAGLNNLRIRWLYDGSTGGIYTIDDIGIPQDPDNVQLIWYYDDDLDNPNNDLEQIGEINQGTVTYTPEKIGWNYFEVQTALVFDTNGDPCQSAENKATIQVYVFDTYTSTATADIGTCGDNSVQLTGVISGAFQGVITEFPDEDESTVAWEVLESPETYTFAEEHFTPSINDPNAIFDPGMGGNFTLQYTITPDEDSPCEPTQTPVQFEILDCTTLDFDGVDDYVDLGLGSYAGTSSIEAWIYPEASEGTIISLPNIEINMSNLPAGVTPNTRWYHIAVTGGELFVDGISMGNSGTGNGGARALIGAKWNESEKKAENHFSGWIEEVRIWNKALTEDQIRFMMNQHLQNAGNMGVEIPMPVPGSLTYADLAGYYRLISAEPDPLLPGGPITYDPALMPQNGLTPDLGINQIPGRLHNMTTHQQNTAPLPYLSKQDGDWTEINTWLRPEVWDIPNSTGISGAPIEWNIVRTFDNITSDAKDVTVLGLKSETVDKLITMANPGGNMDETNSGQMMRVTHYLLLDGNMDLVGESQLLQDSGSILDNASKGWLERDQQGKRNSFVYNYWTSPVSAQGKDNNVAYSVREILRDGTTASNPQTINFQGTYWAADGGKSNPITISTYWIWGFSPATANLYAEWDHVEADGLLKTGEGYTMKGSDGTAGIGAEQNYVFKGKPHNGDFELPIATGQNYLIGNPYPSAIDGHQFIRDNGGGNGVFDGTIYFWDHFIEVDHILAEYIGGYAYLNLSSPTGVSAISNDDRINANDATSSKKPGQFIPVSQGFMINTTGSLGGDIKFKNSQRVYERETGSGSNSLFLSQEKREKTTKNSEDEPPRIRLNFRSPTGYHRQILAAAIPTTTNGFDWGYDALLRDNSVEDMFWLIDEEKYVIQAVPDFNEDQVLPLGVRIKGESEFTFKIDTLENWPADKPLYLKDHLNDSIHDLRKAEYKGTSEAGEILDRFEIVFHKEPDAVIPEEPNPEAELTNIQIRYLHDSRELIIMNPDLIQINEVMIFDLVGKRIQDFEDIPNQKEIILNTRPIGSSVYIVKLLTPSGIKNIKFLMK